MQPNSNLTLIARLDLVRRAIAQRKSNRQIANEIGCDEATIRRDRKILHLPTEALELIRNGTAVDPLLKQDSVRIAEHLHRARAEEELNTARHSRFLADVILEWLSSFNLAPANLLHAVNAVDNDSWYCNVAATNSAVSRPELLRHIAAAKPLSAAPLETFEVINYVGPWLLAWLLRAEPNRKIRAAALNITRITLESKSKSW